MSLLINNPISNLTSVYNNTNNNNNNNNNFKITSGNNSYNFNYNKEFNNKKIKNQNCFLPSYSILLNSNNINNNNNDEHDNHYTPSNSITIPTHIFHKDNNINDNNNKIKKSRKSFIYKDTFNFNIYQVSNSYCMEVCGVSYDTLIFLWTFIKNNNPPFEANSYQLVWTLNWLKDYTQVREGASKWGVGKDLYQKAINNIIKFFGEELNTISLNERNIGSNNSKNKLVIDTLFVETQKPSDKETQSILFSKQHQKYGFKFECCVRNYDGLICWFKGPYPGSAHLLTILDKSGLLQNVGDDEKILAKSDYIGISKKFEFPLKTTHLDSLDIDELLNYEQQNTYCQILDNTMSFLKKFRFCCDRIRTKGSILEHGIKLIANIHNLELENKPPIQCLKKKKI
ncbi:hypothetical protein DICPUDRAFT_78251 [Dictyostelium purpureum]|uniref:DDE Tnp4 domain-containing protein n=1 Tax=Dictyostelium purpureum TaxID=5786 RepID=F0ZJ07_DICPU|nr:uncharacterized protein DICPUDRAFT_78251 [Dictyostelium purpureum]EGC36086.1 hypothetical protein DICPUDRAFT_78251 [Dictyostelium purpureum]|eukprot:XP_003287404.1 hypothetical protein DICPUDRAFT_78251 [Dictyostelium purpureum]